MEENRRKSDAEEDLEAENGTDELDASQHPWLAFAGKLRNNPLYGKWRQAMADYRRERDAEECDFQRIPNLQLEDWTI